MNKLLTKIVGVALGATMAVGVGVAAVKASDGGIQRANAAEQTVSFSSSDFSAATEQPTSASKTGVDISVSKGTISGDQIRVFKGQTLTVSSSDDIKEIVFTCTAQDAAKYGPGCFTTDSGYSYSGYAGTWSGTSKSITFTASSNQVRATAISVKIDTGSAPVIPTISVSPESVVVPKNGTAQLTATPLNGTGSVSWVSNDETIATLNANTGNQVTVTGHKRGTTTITASYSTATPANVTFKVADPEHAGTQADPYTAEDAVDAIDLNSGLTGVYVTGTVSYVQGYYNNKYITYWISSDGTSKTLEIYNGLGIDGADFSSKDDIQVGDIVVVYGNLTKHNTTYEVGGDNQLISLVRPGPATAESIDLSGALSKTTYKTTDASWSHSGLTVTATYSDSTTADVTSSVVWSFNPETPALMGATQSGTLEITATYEELTDSLNAAVTVTAPVVIDPAGTYSLVNSVSDLSNGDTVIITNEDGTKAMSTEQKTNNRAAVDSGKSGSDIVINNPTSIQAFALEIGELDSNPVYSFNTGEGYIYAASSSSNNLKTESELDDNGKFALSISNGVASLVAQGGNSRNTLQYNPNNGTPLFTCYATASQTDVAIYKKAGAVDPTKVTSVTLDKATATVDAGEDVALTATISPSTATTQTATWLTSDATIATVVGGTVTGVAAGTATITAFADENNNGILDNNEKSATCTVTVNSVSGTKYELHTTALVEGDYVVYYDGDLQALKASISSDRAQGYDVEPTGSYIRTEETSIIWHIAQSGEYWTLYNAAEEKYLASTGVKNKAQLLEDGTDDKALWTVTLNEGKFDFVNKANSALGINSTLRSNGSYGFACYATTTGGLLSLYKKASSPTPSGASAYADLFLDLLSTGDDAVCDADGNTNLSSLVTAWGLLADDYDGLSAEDKATLAGGTASESGDNIARALALYDYIGKKYNTRLQTQTLADYNFMSRSSASASNSINPINKVNNTVAIVVVVTISLVSVSALGAYFLLRKKKEER